MLKLTFMHFNGINDFQNSCLILIFSHLTGSKKQFSLIHHNLVHISKRSPKGENMFILKYFQWSALSTLVDRNCLCTNAQPKLLRESSFFTLRKEKSNIKMNGGNIV